MPLPRKCFFWWYPIYNYLYIYTPACANFKGQDVTYGPSKIQVADLLRTPFTNAEKWRFALNLMSHVASKRAEPRETEKPQSASPGKPRPLRCRSSGEPSVSINPKAAMQGPFEWQAPEGSIINRQALRQR